MKYKLSYNQPPTNDTFTRAARHANFALHTGSAWRALAEFARLGPVGAWRYLRYSRLAERLWPRLRLRIAGGL